MDKTPETFKFTVEVTALPNTANCNFPRDIHAREILGRLFQCAICERIENKMHWIVEKNDSMVAYCEEERNAFESIQKSIKST